MKKRLPLLLLLSAALLGLAGVVASFTLPKPPRLVAQPGKPLLGDGEFSDEQIGVCFAPPKGWVMQNRSSEAPEHRPERMLVKYKRFSTDEPPAWIRVRVIDAAENKNAVEFLEGRKPPEPGFRRDVPVQLADLLGRVVAKTVWRGEYSSDGRSVGEHVSEVIAVRHKQQFLEISATYKAGDDKTRGEIAEFLKTVGLTD